jgi:hypothetical protein
MMQTDRRSELSAGVADLVVDARPVVAADWQADFLAELDAMSNAPLFDLSCGDSPGRPDARDAGLAVALFVIPWFLIGWLIWMWG